MEIKILAMDVEKKYWQYSILSLIKQLQSPTSGICMFPWSYVCTYANLHKYIRTYAPHYIYVYVFGVLVFGFPFFSFLLSSVRRVRMLSTCIFMYTYVCICKLNRGSIDAVLQACNETTAVEHPVH